MPYQKQNWEDDVTVITAARMNHIEDGIANIEAEPGPEGPQGMDGEAATIKVGTVESGAVASVTNSGTENAAVFDFVLPKGEQGEQGVQGEAGKAATISIGTVSTGEPDTEAAVVNNGTDEAAVLDFVIPKGEKGEQGEAGAAGEAGKDAPTIESMTLHKDDTGVITGGSLTMSDGSEIAITVTETNA